MESNFEFEKSLLDELEHQSKNAARTDLDRAISQLPTEAPKTVESATRPKLTITSDPAGAEIFIDGVYSDEADNDSDLMLIAIPG